MANKDTTGLLGQGTVNPPIVVPFKYGWLIMMQAYLDGANAQTNCCHSLRWTSLCTTVLKGENHAGEYRDTVHRRKSIGQKDAPRV